MIEIEHNIPIPNSSAKYPFYKLQVGDSFLAPGRKMNSITPLASYWANKTGFTFACRRVEGGIRVWRTK